MNGDKIAICIRGAVGRLKGRVSTQGSLYTDSPYINYNAVYKSLQTHLFEANSGAEFDVFIHSWSTDLELDLVELYTPKKWLFEDNRIYNEEINEKITSPQNFAQCSQLLSMKKSIELMESNGIKYNKVIVIRPDVLLWKDMILSKYDETKVYVNKWIECLGDFHFIMNYDNSIIFKGMFDFAGTSEVCYGEGFIKKYLNSHLQYPIIEDDICAGINQEVIRHLRLTSIDRHNIPISTFYRYGLTEEEILLLVNVNDSQK
jgi:hypothetical protein